MPANYVLLEKITVGAAGASSVTFSSIPQTGYTDLVLAVSARSAATGNPWDDVRLEFNGSGGTAYSTRMLYADGTSPASASTSGNATMSWSYFSNSSATANTFGSIQMYIPNYTSANYKSISSDSSAENNATQNLMALTAGLWSNTAAVTSIKLTNASATNFVQYSTFYLYGVAALGTTPAIVPYATGGDTIMTDGTYWYHAFKASGTFTPAKALSCDYLVVAGGGSGGSTYGGGGGAGGLRSTVTATGGGGSLESAVNFSNGIAYTVTIGAGGSTNASGSNTSVSGTGITTITSTGGGVGGDGNIINGTAGGSGGGGGLPATPIETLGGAGTANQGYVGGKGHRFGMGGGGGAGAVGAIYGSGNNGGNGGAGVLISALATATSTGVSGYYAGGGGGGGWTGATATTGGAGGGGTGSVLGGVNATGGTANTGAGGGGCADGVAGGTVTGGSGIVIIRYAV